MGKVDIQKLERRRKELESFIGKLKKEVSSIAIPRADSTDKLLTLDWELMAIEMQIIRLRNIILSIFLWERRNVSKV